MAFGPVGHQGSEESTEKAKEEDNLCRARAERNQERGAIPSPQVREPLSGDLPLPPHSRVEFVLLQRESLSLARIISVDAGEVLPVLKSASLVPRILSVGQLWRL
ncbi:hypothetical protein GUJ93_ZPchr0004g39459 [Zizania palustris]|uniref:Uncharacterized protein n=1 Tax=Zizania palustris TaxID=103762 RepID=A0A8J5S6N0_ZIZPA|nr:hypothetical protein GUJ93_ZPchr0004g39459 [Zizania palustris]